MRAHEQTLHAGDSRARAVSVRLTVTPHTAFPEARYLWSLKWWRSKTGVTQYLHFQWNSTALRSQKPGRSVWNQVITWRPLPCWRVSGDLQSKVMKIISTTNSSQGYVEGGGTDNKPNQRSAQRKKNPKRNGFHFLNGSSKTENSDSWLWVRIISASSHLTIEGAKRGNCGRRKEWLRQAFWKKRWSTTIFYRSNRNIPGFSAKSI